MLILKAEAHIPPRKTHVVTTCPFQVKITFGGKCLFLSVFYFLCSHFAAKKYEAKKRDRFSDAPLCPCDTCNLLAPNLEARVLRKRDFGEVSARFRRGLSDENILRKLNVN